MKDVVSLAVFEQVMWERDMAIMQLNDLGIGFCEKVNDIRIAKKPIGDLHSVPHYRCPNCNKAVQVYKFDYKYPHCKWCGQKLDWDMRQEV